MPACRSANMKRANILIVLLFAGYLVASAFGTNSVPAITRTSAKSIANVLRSNVAAFSCSNSSAVSYGGVARSFAKSNAVAIRTAASACATAVKKAWDEAGSGCAATGVTSFVDLAATACARAGLQLRANTIANVSSNNSKGRSRAVANACAHSSAHSEVMARAIASGVAKGFEKNGKDCEAFTNITAQTNIRAMASAITKGLAGSYASAATTRWTGKNAAQARGSSLFEADVGVYAKVISQFLTFGCTKCSAKSDCKWCKGLTERGDADSMTDSVAIAAKGKYALASAMSDAVANACEGKITAQAAANATLQAWVDVCIQITAKANGWAAASGNAIACTNSYGNGSAYGLAEAYGRLLIDAAASAFENDECTFEAFANLEATVRARLEVNELVSATARACVEAKGKPVEAEDVAKLISSRVYKPMSKAVSDAIANVLGECKCSGAGYCCNCETRSKDCPY